MNRLEKKCFITAASAHGLLFLILLVGPGFFMQTPKNDSSKPITAFDPSTISMLISQGGTPQSAPTSPLPPPPAPVQETKPVVTPPPVIPPKQEAKPEVKDLDVKTPPKIKLLEKGDEPSVKKSKPKHVVQIDDIEMQSSKTDNGAAQKKALEEARNRAKAQAVAESRRQAEIAKEYGSALKSLTKNLSGSTLVSLPAGVGGGGQASINYRDLIASKYYSAWSPSFNLAEDTPDVMISITVSRDGSVTGRITKRSGNSNMDRSVQNALDAVSFIEPFPPSFTQQQMTIPVVFNLHAKRQ